MDEDSPTIPVGSNPSDAPHTAPVDPSRAWRASLRDVVKAFVPLVFAAAGFALFLTLALTVSHWAWITLHSVLAAMWFVAMLAALAITLFTLAETVPALRVRTQQLRHRIAHRNTTISRLLGWSDPQLPQSLAVRSAILDQYAAKDADEAELRHYEQTLRDANAQRPRHPSAPPASSEPGIPPEPGTSPELRTSPETTAEPIRRTAPKPHQEQQPRPQ